MFLFVIILFEIQIALLNLLIGDIIVGYDEGESIEHVVGNLLVKNEKTLAVAESCTGGRIAAAITAIPGVSSYFKGGMVTYATHSKVELLKIDQALIDKHSVVSGEVAEAMAEAYQKPQQKPSRSHSRSRRLAEATAEAWRQ